MRFTLIFFGLVGLLACYQHSFTDDILSELAQSRTGLAQQQTIGDYTYVIRYISIGQQALKAVDFETKDTTTFKKIIKETEGHHYVYFQILPTQKGQSLQKLYEKRQEVEDWASVQSAINFHYQDQFKLQNPQAAFACKLYHAFPGIDASKGIQFMLVFKDEAAVLNQHFEKDLSFYFVDKHFSKETIAFTFLKSDLNNISKIKL